MESHLDVSFEFRLLIFVIIVAFISPFVVRFFPAFDAVCIALLFVTSSLMSIRRKQSIRMNQFVIFAILVSATYFLIIGLVAHYVLELILWFSFLGILLINPVVYEQYSLQIIKLILFLSAIQILFDFAFPVNAANPLDRFTGTFIMPNNKSRYLLFVLGFVVLSKYKIKTPIHLVMLVTITISMILGSSLFGLIFGVSSLIMAKFVKRFLVFISLLATGAIFSFNWLNAHYLEYDVLLINYNRYLDSDHGVLAVYRYGLQQLAESNYMGVGFGNFSTRAAQFLGSPITNGIPPTMILFNEDLFSSKSPYGLSSIFVFFVELGVFSIPIIILFINILWRTKSTGLWGYFSFYYLFFIMNYNPTFFEFSEGTLYLLTFIATNKFMTTRNYGCNCYVLS